MARPDKFDTAHPTTLPCLYCLNPIVSEKNEIKDDRGTIVKVWYSPSSRYWCDSGPFCSPKCSTEWHKNGKVSKS